jgi:hypothetical protein
MVPFVNRDAVELEVSIQLIFVKVLHRAGISEGWQLAVDKLMDPLKGGCSHVSWRKYPVCVLNRDPTGLRQYAIGHLEYLFSKKSGSRSECNPPFEAWQKDRSIRCDVDRDVGSAEQTG